MSPGHAARLCRTLLFCYVFKDLLLFITCNEYFRLVLSSFYLYIILAIKSGIIKKDLKDELVKDKERLND